jgi:hypothetical protein
LTDRYDVGRVHVVVVAARLERLHKKAHDDSSGIPRSGAPVTNDARPRRTCQRVYSTPQSASCQAAKIIRISTHSTERGPNGVSATDCLAATPGRGGEAIGIRSSVPHDNPIARQKSEFKQLTSTVQERRAACSDDLLAKPRDIDVRLALTACWLNDNDVHLATASIAASM